MPPFKDLTGQQFGALKVLGLADHKYACPNTGQATLLWRVRCDLCGREKDLPATSIKKAKSCGCLNDSAPKYRKCSICGKPFRVYPSTKKLCCSLHSSASCSSIAGSPSEQITSKSLIFIFSFRFLEQFGFSELFQIHFCAAEHTIFHS